MNDLEQRVKNLENKVKILEETLDTLKNMQLSEQMEEYIRTKTKSLRMIDLINTVSDKPSLDFEEEQRKFKNIRSAKRTIDNQVASALKNVGTFSEDYPDDPRYFNYEIESGLEQGWDEKYKNKVEVLTPFVGKGIRITSYNGFESERVIIPKEIDGYPVVSIGEKAFMNATISQLILPSSLKAIMRSAFQGCKKLTQLDLPEGLLHLGDYCLADTGLISITIPNTIKKISIACFANCQDLETVLLGNQVTNIDIGAFRNCTKLRQLSLPESIQAISSQAFEGTAIQTMIFPESLRKISCEAFSSNITLSRSNFTITCVFLGLETIVEGTSLFSVFKGVRLIYCLPGSNVQKFARENSIAMKPLSEFRMEEHI